MTTHMVRKQIYITGRMNDKRLAELSGLSESEAIRERSTGKSVALPPSDLPLIELPGRSCKLI
jgi:hypothetical protein